MEEIVNWVGVEWRNGSEGCPQPNLLALMKKNVDGIGKFNGKIALRLKWIFEVTKVNSGWRWLKNSVYCQTSFKFLPILPSKNPKISKFKNQGMQNFKSTHSLPFYH